MSAFELNIYGKDDEILKTFSTERIRWGIFLQAVAIHEETAGKSDEEMCALVGEFVKKLFPGITDADIENADAGDVFSVFWQLVNKVNKIGYGSKKNGVTNPQTENT